LILELHARLPINRFSFETLQQWIGLHRPECRADVVDRSIYQSDKKGRGQEMNSKPTVCHQYGQSHLHGP